MAHLHGRSLASILSLALAIGAMGGCCMAPAGAPPPYQSDEVPIQVLVADPSNPKSVVVVPESTYLAFGKQVPHWIPVRGEVTKIEFKQESPFERPVPCSNGHCKPVSPPNKKGIFHYSVTITLDGKEYSVDPQLIVG